MCEYGNRSLNHFCAKDLKRFCQNLIKMRWKILVILSCLSVENYVNCKPANFQQNSEFHWNSTKVK